MLSPAVHGFDPPMPRRRWAEMLGFKGKSCASHPFSFSAVLKVANLASQPFVLILQHGFEAAHIGVLRKFNQLLKNLMSG